MNWSKYNVLFDVEEDKSSHFLYNILSGFFTVIDDDFYLKLIQIKNNIGKIDILSLDEKNLLIKNKVIVNSDDYEMYKMKIALLKGRYDMQTMKLTIAPTCDCNFKCVYCFEKDRPAIYMTKKVEDAIFDFIVKNNPNRIHVCWYGGEPLLAKESIYRISEKIISLGKEYDSSIVTNGYLLDREFIHKMNDLKLKTVQITIDGDKQTHNKRRPHNNNADSFDVIMNNIKELSVSNKDVLLSIRINVDKTNMYEFVNVYRQIKKINPSIHVYPGFVHDASCKSSVCIDDNVERIKFYSMLYNDYNIYIPEMIPNIVLSSCMARCMNSFLIGPMGEIYKCWHHLGNNNKVVGNLMDKRILTDIDMFARLMKENDYIDNKKCMDCKYFPVCGGGCADLKTQNNNDNCSIFKYAMTSFLNMRYKFLVNKV